MVNVVMHREWHRRIGPVHAGAARVHQVLNAVVATAFQDMGKADDVAVDVGQRVLDGVTHTSLGGEVDDTLWLMGGEALLHGVAVTQVDVQVRVVGMTGMPSQAGLFQGRVVVVVMVVNTDDGIATFKQSEG